MTTMITELPPRDTSTGRFLPAGLPLTAESSYRAKHYSVNYLRGPASAFLCACGCGRRARDWATKAGDDGTDVWNDYQPLARICHLIYDRSPFIAYLMRRGEAVAQAKLTRDQVREIRALSGSGESERQLADRYGVSEQTVRDVATRRTWGWLLDDPGGPPADTPLPAATFDAPPTMPGEEEVSQTGGEQSQCLCPESSASGKRPNRHNRDRR